MTRKDDAIENRTRLLRAAAEQFAEQGLARANVNEISLAAGLAKGTVYNHFPSKRELFLAVVKEAFKLAEQIPEPPADASLRSQLESLLAADVAWIVVNESFARVVVREMLNPDPELYPQILAASAPFIDRAAAIRRVGAQRGEVWDDIPSSAWRWSLSVVASSPSCSTGAPAVTGRDSKRFPNSSPISFLRGQVRGVGDRPSQSS